MDNWQPIETAPKDGTEIFGVASQAAKEAARLYDGIIRDVLDKALGKGGWTMADLGRRGRLLGLREGVTHVLWDDRHLATIRQQDELVESSEPLTIRWSRKYEVEQHITHFVTSR